MELRRIGNSPILHVSLVVAVGLLAYSNSFDVPFQFDDFQNILENSGIKDASRLAKPSILSGTRAVGHLSLALNYRIHGLNVAGYHVFNLAVHLLAAVFLYMLTLLTFRTPRMEGALPREDSRITALFTALLFVAHPVQTQAVTYIVQRLTSLAAMFYIGSLVFYVKWRLRNPPLSPLKLRGEYILAPPFSKGGKGGLFYQKGLFYLLSLLFAVLAMKTKETAFTLPLTIVLYELVFFRVALKKWLLYMVPPLLTILIIPLSLLRADKPLGQIIGDMERASRMLTDMPRSEYLITQFRVIVTYLRLLFFPSGQNVYYDYPVYKSLSEPQALASFALLLLILCLGAYLLYRSRGGDPSKKALKITAFGIFWFFLALSVESSVIPIKDVIFEHRVYLPSAGFFMAMTTLIVIASNRLKPSHSRKALIAFMAFITLSLAAATYLRNEVWRTEIGLWEDVAAKSPKKPEVYFSLTNAYISQKMYDKAIEAGLRGLKVDPLSAGLYNNLGVAYDRKNMPEKAVRYYEAALLLQPDAKRHSNLGTMLYKSGMYEKAVEHFEAAIKLKPDYAEAHTNLGSVLASMGRIEEAKTKFLQSLRVNPDFIGARMNLAALYGNAGMHKIEVEHLLLALRAQPGNPDIHQKLAVAYSRLGQKAQSEEHYRLAESLRIQRLAP